MLLEAASSYSRSAHSRDHALYLLQVGVTEHPGMQLASFTVYERPTHWFLEMRFVPS
jgi:hypothetical protein